MEFKKITTVYYTLLEKGVVQLQN